MEDRKNTTHESMLNVVHRHRPFHFHSGKCLKALVKQESIMRGFCLPFSFICGRGGKTHHKMPIFGNITLYTRIDWLRGRVPRYVEKEVLQVGWWMSVTCETFRVMSGYYDVNLKSSSWSLCDAMKSDERALMLNSWMRKRDSFFRIDVNRKTSSVIVSMIFIYS